MKNYALLLEYDGLYFQGLQKQKPEISTIQATIEKSLFQLLNEKVYLHFAGRTDSGVHSIGMVVNFKTNKQILNYHQFLVGINALNLKGVVAKNIQEMPLEFHSQFSCTARKYNYFILNSKYPSPLFEKKAFWYPYKINFERLKYELSLLKGENDFRSCSKKKSILYKNTKRKILDVDLQNTLIENLFYISIKGNGFLHNMVRTLIGTLLDITRGKIKSSILEVLTQKDRRQAGINLPSYGLYFVKAYYEQFSQIENLYLNH